MKQKILSKKIFLIQIALSALSFLLPLFPTLYSEDNRFIQPISGYSSFVFLNDKESTFLYYGTLMLSLYLAFMAILFIFGAVSLFMPKEREKGDKRVSLLFLSLSLIASIVLVVFLFADSGSESSSQYWKHSDSDLLCYLLCDLFDLLHSREKEKQSLIYRICNNTSAFINPDAII